MHASRTNPIPRLKQPRGHPGAELNRAHALLSTGVSFVYSCRHILAQSAWCCPFQPNPQSLPIAVGVRAYACC